MSNQLKVMISSTARDLPEHRQEVMDACLRQGMFPIMMEHLPASDDEAIPSSLKMADEADIYLLILAHRYGYVPEANNPEQRSVTELEYNCAVERKIPILTFVMHEDHPVKAADVEKGEGAVKLETFKNRALLKVTNFFKSPAELRANVIDSLSDSRQKNLTAFHYVGDIPAPPEKYIAHPYTLLQTHRLIGRKEELNLLTDWVSDKELPGGVPANSVSVMSVIAIGGMGKSALTWKWFQDIAPEEMKLLAGRMWWSFYESDATFENLVTRALAYVTRRRLDEVRRMPSPDREAELLAALHREPFLLVLDGLERILIAYARTDASRLDDRPVGKDKNLRKTADPRVGRFLKKLTQIKNSRILISSRLQPAELETEASDLIPGAYRRDLLGLNDEDAVDLWRAFKVSGSCDELLPVFATFGKHPLVIQALAGEVRRYHRAPGDFGAWRESTPQFDPGRFPKVRRAMAHVLQFALRELEPKTETVLRTIAAFRMPTTYDTLAAVLVGSRRLCADEPELDAALTELEDRALLGWDRRANRYDLHPIVRSVAWNGLDKNAQRRVYTSLHKHFEALPMVSNFLKIQNLEDLASAIELFNTLIGLGRYDDATELLRDRLKLAALYRLNATRQLVELLEMLFPDGLDKLPRLRDSRSQAYVLNALALGYQFIGQPGRAIILFRRQIRIHSPRKSHKRPSRGVRNLADALRRSGALFESEAAICRALISIRKRHNRYSESLSLFWLGSILAVRGNVRGSQSSLDRALRIFIAKRNRQFEGLINSSFSQILLWQQDFAAARQFANRAWELAHILSYEKDHILAARVQGETELGLKGFAVADERLHCALTRARTVNLVEEELPALVALAELRRRQGEAQVARQFLDDVWEAAERGPYPLIHADAFNVLTQIERDQGNKDAAVEAATKAYRLAWCDGPPFAYHWGLEKAKQHLKELGAPEPDMPPFDESKFEPMPEVEIDPDDEFHVGESPEVG